MSQEGIVRHQGTSYFVKEGRAQKVDDEMKLSEGITAKKDGKVTLKDGTEVNLEDGKMVTLEGKVVDTPPQVAAKVPAGSGDSPSTSQSPATSTSPGTSTTPSTQE